MTKPHHSARQLGFTVVELMMSLAVLTVGISGIIAMQKVTAASNLHSKSVAIATQIANSWQDQLLVDGSVWRITRPLSLNSTPWLINATTPNVWFRPQFVAARQFGAAFDALGNPLADTEVAQAQFCVHVLLVPVVAALTDPGNATYRATIRVLWPRPQSTQTETVNFCALSNNPVTIGNATDRYHSLYQTFAIRVHP
jgi:hypothetical protein